MTAQLFAASIVIALLAIIVKKARTVLLTLAGISIVAALAVAYNEAESTTTTPPTAPTVEEMADARTVEVTFTSDPNGAIVLIENSHVGTTPHTAQVPPGQLFDYTLRAEEPYEEYDLYKPYSASLTPDEDVAVDVWLDRTTAEEQQAQREEQAQARAEAEERRLQAELRSSPWRVYRRVDPITDADISYITVDATDYPTVLNRDAYMTIRCDRDDPTASDGIALIIEADDYLGNDDIALGWRFDDNPAVRRRLWRSSTDGTAVFNLSYKTQFLTQMLDAEELTVRLYDYRGSSLNYAFDVDGGRAALTLLGCYGGPAL